MALRSFLDPPPHYYHFVDDGFGHFRNRSHAESFLAHFNSLSPDLEYTIEHPSADGSIPFLDVLIHTSTPTIITYYNDIALHFKYCQGIAPRIMHVCVGFTKQHICPFYLIRTSDSDMNSIPPCEWHSMSDDK